MTIDELNKLTEDTVKNIFRIVNNDERVLAEVLKDKLLREHRTLQSCFLRAIKEVVEEYSKQDPSVFCDARNEYAHMWAVAVANAAKDIHLPFI